MRTSPDVAGLYAVGTQLRPPPTCGQTIFVSPSPGISRGSTIFSPVVGLIAVMPFCSPRSIDDTYLPLCVSTMSKIACLPAVTTTLVGTPPTGSSTTCRSNAQSRSHWPFAWCWKCHASSPVSGFSASVVSRYRPSFVIPSRPTGSRSGPVSYVLPGPKNARLCTGS